MPWSADDKDEIRYLIARETRDAAKSVINAVVNMPIELGEVQRAMSPEGMAERQARQRIAQQVGARILDALEDRLRDADAKVVEKEDPERAKFIRNFKPTF